MHRKGHALRLNNGIDMPAVGLGVYQSTKEETAAAVAATIAAGYGLIDTAAGYDNEEEVGNGIRESGVARGDIFVTTKSRARNFGYDSALEAFDASSEKLRLDVLDLYLLHWPVPCDFDNTIASWKACEKLLAEGRVRAIGVCNFTPMNPDALLSRCDIVPMCESDRVASVLRSARP